ncbi:MAG: hypothetical protein MUP16_11745 [Sedimentisphaerales bacterium]|nr:hypothetical protein [Sedimentisphaerales bacterium]
MNSKLRTLLILALILVGLFIIVVRFSQVAQGFVGSGYFFDTDPNEPEPGPELAANICQIIRCSDEPNEPNEPTVDSPE